MKAISKIVAVLAVSALAFGMFGCSSAASTNPDEAKSYTAEEAKAQDITVEQSGYSIVTVPTTDADGNAIETTEVNFAFIAQNPNAGYVAQNVPFNVSGYNAAGETVFSGGVNCMYMYPGIETALSGTTQITEEAIDTEIASFEVVPLLATVEYLKTDLSAGDLAKMFTISDDTVETIEGGVTVSATITGDIKDGDKIFKVANLENTLEGHAIVIFTNADGNIVYGTDSSNVLIDSSTAELAKTASEDGTPLDNFNVTAMGVPEYTGYQIYVMPGL